MYQATLILDADAGVLAVPEAEHVANELALRAWKNWRESGSSSSAFETLDMDMVDDYIASQSVDQRMNLRLRADINASSGFIQENHSRITIEPSCKNAFLLIPAT